MQPQYHQRYNPNLVDDDNQELTAHLRARRLRARRLTMYTLAGDVPSEPEQMDQDSLHGSTALPTQGSQALSGGPGSTTDTESDNETKGSPHLFRPSSPPQHLIVDTIQHSSD